MASWTSNVKTRICPRDARTASPDPGAGNSGGFTLLEVLVALAVIALALAAAIKTSAESASNTNYLRDRTMAQWVATDRLREMQALEVWGTGKDEGRRELAGRTWYWRTEITNTPVANMRRVEVTVYDSKDGEYPLGTQGGFISNPILRRN